ncbi:MAG: hypothetical protein HYT89_05110 [Candidatus Omnitrophica bacterium]|nr:hypothetical protein [Candidatus Omnitrophota bacterium]
MQKLEQTEANLLRMGDVIQEVKRQIAMVERQAKKAAVYKTEFEKLKTLEVAVASEEFLLFEGRRHAKEAAAAALKEKEREFLATAEETEKKIDGEKGEVDRLDEAFRRAQGRGAEVESEIRKHQDRISLNRERVGELIERAGHLGAQIESASKRVEETLAESIRLGEEFELIRKEEAEGLVFLESVERDFNGFEAEAQRFAREESLIREKLAALAAQSAHRQAEIAKICAHQNALGLRLRRIKQEEETLLQEIRESDPGFTGPLFDPAQPPPSSVASRLALRSQTFKQRVLSIFKAMIEKNRSAPGPEEENELDTEIKSFGDELLKIQAGLSDERVRRRDEDRLRLLASEAQEIAAEQNGLAEKEREMESGGLLAAEEEKAQNNLLAERGRKIREVAAAKEGHLVRLTETRSRHSHCTARREKIEKDKNWIESLRAQEADQQKLHEREREESGVRKAELEKENERLESEITRLSASRDALMLETESLRLQKEERSKTLVLIEKEAAEKRGFLNSAREETHALDLENAEIRHEIDKLKERIFNAYQVDLAVQLQVAETEAGARAAFGTGAAPDLETARTEIASLKDRLGRMGPVNLVAITEHEEMRQRYEFLAGQEKDLLRAKEDLHKAIVRINRTTREMFVGTFAEIQKNFGGYFKALFGGGSAELLLLDEGDVLESGVEIVVRPPGKKLQNISLLSGGEKALTAVALLFSLFKVKPSPFCVLDEVDAPLDESNVDRFCNVLKEFIVNSQFIVITHNKRTMNLADTLYGITMAETGISRVVSVRFSDRKARERQEVLV